MNNPNYFVSKVSRAEALFVNLLDMCLIFNRTYEAIMLYRFF